jgi:hypothetical protein
MSIEENCDEKNTNDFLGLLVFILPLSAYSVSVLKSSTIHQEQTNSDHSSNKIIRKTSLIGKNKLLKLM